MPTEYSDHSERQGEGNVVLEKASDPSPDVVFTAFDELDYSLGQQLKSAPNENAARRIRDTLKDIAVARNQVGGWVKDRAQRTKEGETPLPFGEYMHAMTSDEHDPSDNLILAEQFVSSA